MTNYSTNTVLTALGNNHGYRLDGDFVQLTADVSVAEHDVADGTLWSLQLWANPCGFESLALSGVKVAEFQLQPVAGQFSVDACVNALPPAGAADQIMALALVAQSPDGSIRVSELSVYPNPQNFTQPALFGNISCELADGIACIGIDSITNPRNPDNLSGSLALELWALDAPYSGGAWCGQPVASVVLGQLQGQSSWTDCSYSVPAVLADTSATLTLMLREWTPAGYVTRDFRNITLTNAAQAVEAVEAVEASEPVKAAEVETVETTEAVVANEAPAGTQQPEVVEAADTPTSKTARKAAKKSPKKAIAKPEADARVSINTASVDELATVKGLRRSVAEAIVAARPFGILGDVVRVKGMGVKLYEKVAGFLKL